MYQSTNQSINQPTSQSINQSIKFNEKSITGQGGLTRPLIHALKTRKKTLNT